MAQAHQLEPLDYIDPRSLHQNEVEYEMRIRGMNDEQSRTFSFERKMSTLDALQRSEQVDHNTSQMTVPNNPAERHYIEGLLHHSAYAVANRAQVPPPEEQRMIPRLLHAYNRARRLQVHNPVEQGEKERLMRAALHEIHQWRQPRNHSTPQQHQRSPRHTNSVWGSQIPPDPVTARAEGNENPQRVTTPENRRPDLQGLEGPQTERRVQSPTNQRVGVVENPQPQIAENELQAMQRTMQDLLRRIETLGNPAQMRASPARNDRRDTSSDSETSLSSEEDGHVVRHTAEAPRYTARKPIPPDRWGFSFSGGPTGNARDTTPQNFLAMMEANRRSEGYNKATMLTFMNVLLTGSAKIWWINNQKKIRDYKQFIERFKAEWYVCDFETVAFIELCSYKQNEEDIMAYLTAFETRVYQCNPRPSEAQVVGILRRNVRAEFRDHLLLAKPKTLAAVRQACKEKNEAEKAKGNQRRPPREEEKPRREKPAQPKGRYAYAIDILGAEIDSGEEYDPSPYEVYFVQSQKERGNPNAQPRREYHCFNCGKLGHMWRQCPDKITTPFCMHCGKKGVKISTCSEEACKHFHETRVRKRAERADKF